MVKSERSVFKKQEQTLAVVADDKTELKHLDAERNWLLCVVFK